MSKECIPKKILRSLICLSCFGGSIAIADSVGTPWTYEGKNGPSAWGKVDPAFELCSAGTYQSPIDIQSKDRPTFKKSAALEMQYHLEKDILTETQTDRVLAKHETGNIIHNGHTLQVELQATDNDVLMFKGQEYKLIKFHFHTPSEHTIDGHVFPAEAHYIHQNKKGELLVVGVFIEKGEASNKSLAELIKHAPAAIKQPITIKQNHLDLPELIPPLSDYYAYQGSLTTPPCNQAVQWIVLEKPAYASQKQIKQLEKILGNNARPLQNTGSRVVTKNIVKT